ncbi:Cell wall protein TIR3 [Penicillium macrosclerotiorum]|uniref:Cell wall protein TIR3 n=1 Tax=Penicillium macrosclerotiorum TaxID=303699 RepID=UPI002549BE10|nr:Cell wall protein TIR3 [Penicillium macrosclerotiorum]KAJ5678638.1 Cell wall protein TIR3 [Penicillium macrosclerotiorum]
MKLTQITLAATALFATAIALSLDDLPSCATSCATDAIPAKCGIDVECICSDSSFLSDITCCVATACSTADQETTLKVAKSICASGGVTNLPTTVACSSTASSTGTETSSKTSSKTESKTTTATNASETTLTGSATTSAASATETGSSSAAASSAAATTGAAILGQTKDSSLMAAAGAAAAFAVFL